MNAQTFSNISSSISNANINTDSETVQSAVSSVATREIQPPELTTDYILTDTLIPDQFLIDAKPFIERPFYLTTVDWDVSADRGYLLPNVYTKLPGDVLNSNPSLLSATKIASLYRCDLELVVSVAGTITHSGCVICGILPPLYGELATNVYQLDLINTLMTGPHVRLFANEATSAIIKVPWYCNTEMATLDLEPKDQYVPSIDITPINGNYGTLVFLVLNRLSPSAGSSTSLKITVEAVFKSLDMRVPTPRYVKWVTQSSFLTTLGTSIADNLATKAKSVSADFIDKARQYLKIKTGLHNPNSSIINQRVVISKRNFLNTVDTQTYYETLDTCQGVNRIVDCPIFNTSDDEMLVSHIVSKKQYLGTIRMNQDDPTGLLLWARPISPNQFYFDNTSPTNVFTNNIRLLHSLTRSWRGDLRITIEAVMNNKQQAKLRLIQMYNPSVDCLFGTPEYRSVLNAPSHLMEFSAGGQTHDVVLPYLCRNEMTPCAIDPNAESLFHGMYYIYVAQPMANSGDSPKDIYFNIYISGEPSLQFFGYSTTPAIDQFPGVVVPAQNIAQKFVTQSMKVMNEPQKQNDKVQEESPREYVNRLQRIDSVRDLIRRVYPVSKFSRILKPGYNYITFDMDEVYGEAPQSVSQKWSNPMQIVSRMYYGKFPSTRFQLRLITFKDEGTEKGNESLISSIYYAPQQQYVYAPEGTVNGTRTTDLLAELVMNDETMDFPLPYQTIAVESSLNFYVHEFSVPNTSIFKFVGGPKKNAYTYLSPNAKFASQDCGCLIFVLNNPYSYEVPIELLLSAGASDECRFGFHAVAPRIQLPSADPVYITYGLGSVGNPLALPSLDSSPYINFSRT